MCRSRGSPEGRRPEGDPSDLHITREQNYLACGFEALNEKSSLGTVRIAIVSSPRPVMANVSKLVLSLPPGTTADQIRTILAGGHHSKSDLTAARTFFSNKLSTPVDFPRRKNEKAVDIIEHIAEMVAFSNGTGPKPSFLDDDDQTPTSSPLRKTARGTGGDETPTSLPGRRLSFSLPDDNGATNSSETGEPSLQSLSQILKALAATVANQAETITTSVRTALREDIQTEIKTELQTIVKRVETKVIEATRASRRRSLGHEAKNRRQHHTNPASKHPDR